MDTENKMTTTETTTAAAADEFMTIKEACNKYRIERRALLALVDKGEFPKGLRVSERRWLFKRADVTAWEEGRWVRPGDLAARADAAGSSLRQPPAHRPGASANSQEHQHDAC